MFSSSDIKEIKKMAQPIATITFFYHLPLAVKTDPRQPIQILSPPNTHYNSPSLQTSTPFHCPSLNLYFTITQFFSSLSSIPFLIARVNFIRFSFHLPPTANSMLNVSLIIQFLLFPVNYNQYNSWREESLFPRYPPLATLIFPFFLLTK